MNNHEKSRKLDAKFKYESKKKPSQKDSLNISAPLPTNAPLSCTNSAQASKANLGFKKNEGATQYKINPLTHFTKINTLNQLNQYSHQPSPVNQPTPTATVEYSSTPNTSGRSKLRKFEESPKKVGIFKNKTLIQAKNESPASPYRHSRLKNKFSRKETHQTLNQYHGNMEEENTKPTVGPNIYSYTNHNRTPSYASPVQKKLNEHFAVKKKTMIEIYTKSKANKPNTKPSSGTPINMNNSGFMNTSGISNTSASNYTGRQNSKNKLKHYEFLSPNTPQEVGRTPTSGMMSALSGCTTSKTRKTSNTEMLINSSALNTRASSLAHHSNHTHTRTHHALMDMISHQSPSNAGINQERDCNSSNSKIGIGTQQMLTTNNSKYLVKSGITSPLSNMASTPSSNNNLHHFQTPTYQQEQLFILRQLSPNTGSHYHHEEGKEANDLIINSGISTPMTYSNSKKKVEKWNPSPNKKREIYVTSPGISNSNPVTIDINAIGGYRISSYNSNSSLNKMSPQNKEIENKHNYQNKLSSQESDSLKRESSKSNKEMKEKEEPLDDKKKAQLQRKISHNKCFSLDIKKHVQAQANPNSHTSKNSYSNQSLENHNDPNTIALPQTNFGKPPTSNILKVAQMKAANKYTPTLMGTWESSSNNRNSNGKLPMGQGSSNTADTEDIGFSNGSSRKQLAMHLGSSSKKKLQHLKLKREISEDNMNNHSNNDLILKDTNIRKEFHTFEKEKDKEIIDSKPTMSEKKNENENSRSNNANSKNDLKITDPLKNQFQNIRGGKMTMQDIEKIKLNYIEFLNNLKHTKKNQKLCKTNIEEEERKNKEFREHIRMPEIAKDEKLFKDKITFDKEERNEARENFNATAPITKLAHHLKVNSAGDMLQLMTQQSNKQLPPKINNTQTTEPNPHAKAQILVKPMPPPGGNEPPYKQITFTSNNLGHNYFSHTKFEGTGNIDDYLIGKQIGKGAYAIVKLAIHKPSYKKIALKIYDKSNLVSPQRRKSVRREILILEKLHHQSIVKLYEAFDTNNHVILAMEYIPGISLHTLLKSKSNRRLDENEAKIIFRQIVSGIRYCHSKCVTHRDIKLENLLVDENTLECKIIDFGFSTCIPNDKKIKIFCGTPSYMAPEIVSKKEYEGPPADIWALGVLLYALLCGTFPFKGHTDKELYTKIMNAQFKIPDHLSALATSLILRILNIDSSQRPTASKILNDPWIKNDTHLEKPIAGHYRSQSYGAGMEHSNDKVNDEKRDKRQNGFNMEAYQEYFNNQTYEPPVTNQSNTNLNPLAQYRQKEDQPLSMPLSPQERPSTKDRKLDYKKNINNYPAGNVAHTINNNFNIVNHITEVKCKCKCQPHCKHYQKKADNQNQEPKLNQNTFQGINLKSPLKEKDLSNNQNIPASKNYDFEQIQNIMKLGYNVDEVLQNIGNENSHLHKLYKKLVSGHPKSAVTPPYSHTQANTLTGVSPKNYFEATMPQKEIGRIHSDPPEKEMLNKTAPNSNFMGAQIETAFVQNSKNKFGY